MRLSPFHLERKVAIKTKSVFKRCCHIGILSLSRCLGYWVHSFWADKESRPLKPQPSLTSGSVTKYSYFCDRNSSKFSYTHKIHSRHFLLHLLFHILNLTSAVQVVTEINSCLYQLSKESLGAWTERGSIASLLPKSLKTWLSARLHSGFKCKITILGPVKRYSEIYTSV